MLPEFKQLFKGRSEVYARAFPKNDKPGKVGYELIEEPLTDERLFDHLSGKTLLGQYQLLQNNTVHWFAVDFDMSKDESELALDQKGTVLGTAMQQMEVFEEAGLSCYLEVSRSGNGAHVWGFFEEGVAAAEVRAALKPLLIDADSYDRLYPVQTSVSTAKPYGNLIALPFFGALGKVANPKLGPGVQGGASVFLNRDTLAPVDPLEFLRGVFVNRREVIHELASRAPKLPALGTTYSGEAVPFGEVNPAGRPEKLGRGVLKLISDYGCQFMSNAFQNRRTLPEPQWYAAIQQLTCFENGREAAHLLSKDYAGYNPAETDTKYTHALQHPPVSCAYIQEHFPKNACKGCTCGAPYRKAQGTIEEVTKRAEEPLLRSDFKGSTARMQRRKQGAEPDGISWGMAGLDKYTRLRPKELTVIGAMPSIGKTAFVVDAVYSLASRGVPVFMFSAETGQEGFEDRLLARVSGVDSRAIRGERMRLGVPFPLTDDEEAAVLVAAETLRPLPIYINYTVTRPDTILNVLEDALLRNMIGFDEPYVVFMDYLQFAANGEDDFAALSKATMEFKALAKIIRQSVVLLSQLQRKTEGDDTPLINWFKGTGRIENDADVAMILTGERIPGPIAKRKMSIVKQREGDAGVHISLKFYQTCCLFEEEELTAIPTGIDLFAQEAGDAYDK